MTSHFRRSFALVALVALVIAAGAAANDATELPVAEAIAARLRRKHEQPIEAALAPLVSQRGVAFRAFEDCGGEAIGEEAGRRLRPLRADVTIAVRSAPRTHGTRIW
jgi:hypothetical protein